MALFLFPSIQSEIRIYSRQKFQENEKYAAINYMSFDMSLASFPLSSRDFWLLGGLALLRFLGGQLDLSSTPLERPLKSRGGEYPPKEVRCPQLPPAPPLGSKTRPPPAGRLTAFCFFSSLRSSGVVFFFHWGRKAANRCGPCHGRGDRNRERSSSGLSGK